MLQSILDTSKNNELYMGSKLETSDEFSSSNFNQHFSSYLSYDVDSILS